MLSKLELTSVPIIEGIPPSRVYKKLKGMIDHMGEFYQMRTRRPLIVFTIEDGWVFCVEDTHENVLVYRWLKGNAERLAEGMVFLIVEEFKEKVNGVPT